MIDRLPPANIEAEQAVLGAAMLDRDMYDIAAAVVVGSDFHAPLHETIWAAIAALVARNIRPDKVSLAEELRAHGLLDKIGGAGYLSTCMDALPTAASTEYYAKLVREKSSLRALIRAGRTITDLGYEGESDAPAALASAEQALASVTMRGSDVLRIENAGAVAWRILDRIASGATEPSYRSPWGRINELCGGFMPGELVAWVASPKIGKSGVVLGLADYTARHYGAVALFAPENGAERTAMRHLAMYTGISARRQREGQLDAHAGELSTLIEASRRIAALPLYLFGREIRSLASMWRALRMIARERPLAAIVLDHVGKLEDVRNERGKQNEHQRLTAAYESLIDMAHEFRCPVHAVQHLNRDGMTTDRAGNFLEPTLSSIKHVRGGGNIEGNADAIIFPHRPLPLGTFEERQIGKFIVALTRDGDGGSCDMRYIGWRNLWLEHDEASGQTAVPWFETGRVPRNAEREPEPVLDHIF